MNAPAAVMQSTRIDHVTVYQRGAQITRRARLTPGAVIVPDLPLLYLQGSLRVLPEKGEVSNVRDSCTAEFGAPPKGPDAGALSALDLNRALVVEEQRENKKLIALVEAVTPEKQKSLKWSTLPDYKRWLGVLDAKGPLLRSLHEESAALDKRLRSLDEERDALVRNAHQKPAPPSFRRGLAFSLASDSGDAVDVAISYFVTGAVWLPSYTLNLDGTAADLRFAAHIAQATGEDWTGVELSVCTGNYDGHVRAPELVSWRIGRAQPPTHPAYRPLPPGLEELFVTYDKAVSEHGTSPSAGGVRATGRSAQRLSSVTPSQLFDSSTRGAPPAPASPRGPPPVPAMQMMRDDSDMLLDDAPSADDALSFGGSAQEEITAEAAVDGAEYARERNVLAKKGAARSLDMPLSAPPPAAAMRSSAGPAPDVIGANQVSNTRTGHDAQYLRLVGAARGRQRGQLVPADPTTHLGTLIDDFDFDAHYSTLDAAIREFDRAAARVAHQPLPPRAVQLSKNRFRRTYSADAPCTIAADGQYHRVSVKRYTLDHIVAYRAVPHLDEQFYRTSMISGADEPLPDGPIQVYDRGAYLTTATLDETGDDGALLLSLGPHPAIRVTDRVVSITQSEKGLINNRSHVEHSVEMTIRSALTEAVGARVYGRIPIPDENASDIEVELMESSLPLERNDRGAHGERVRGGFVMTTTLEPGAKLTVRYRFAITLPSKMELVGGNRRNA